MSTTHTTADNPSAPGLTPTSGEPHHDRPLRKATTAQLLAWFMRIFMGVKMQSCINAISGIVRVALDFAFIWATKVAIDIATGEPTAATTALPHPTTLFSAGSLLIALMALQLAIGYLGRWIAALLGVDAQNRMQRRIFEHLLRSEWSGREARHSGDVLGRLISDCQTVVGVVTDTVPQALAVMVRLVAASAFLFIMDAKLAVTVLLILPVFILLSRLYIHRMRDLTRQVRQTDSHIQATLQESIQHRLVLKTLERINTILDKLTQLQQTLRHQVRHRTIFSSTSNLVLNIGFGAAYLFTFLWSANRLAEGTITFGMMTAFIQLCGQIQGPFRELTRFIPTIIGSFTAAERLMELEETPVEDDDEPVHFNDGVGIRINHVDYAYRDGNRQILSDLSLDCPPHTATAILGETGAGKTTLLRLILALLQPARGTIEMYANDGTHLNVSARTRCNIVYVPQGNTLFSGTLRWNLQLGKPDATESEMWHTLSLACADFVESLPAGLDTVIGEGGAGLSEGQAQRIAIARALLRQGSMLLLDEATSALDAATEEKLLNNLIDHGRHQANKPTLIFITHRPAVVKHCSQVVTLKKNQS